ncbi:MAG: aminoacyl-tRNA hydrolase [Rickettsiales bacterium]|jgi:PTH1 family peptidyl-tRNA hydrolase|nr:aminoacyl-tRNA hydrolase [Rickettsiales bacterium]
MKLIIGLGNPGAKYDGTRHNIGFAAVDLLVSDADWKSFKTALVAKREDFIFAKPQTFMNLSGRAALEIGTFYKILPQDIIVIHDDIDLQPGDIRTKIGGGSAGHNGIKSIDEAIGKNYTRIRIGVGHPKDKVPFAGEGVDAEGSRGSGDKSSPGLTGGSRPIIPVEDWVLSRPSTDDAKLITTALSQISNILKDII